MPIALTSSEDPTLPNTVKAPVGRFAPSPTGDLHFGSLLAAMSSYCQVKQAGGTWNLRIDDIDGPRSTPGSAESIQQTLLEYGLQWDGIIMHQSDRIDHYLDALRKLIKQQRIFACSCSRRSLGVAALYPGNCRSQLLSNVADGGDPYVPDHALRCRMTGAISFEDAVQGSQNVDLRTAIGDSIIWRRDNIVSYTLACALDDAENTTEVVRGADLLSSTSAQLAIMNYLNLPTPKYAHIPVAVDKNGDKLSKHSKAKAISKQPIIPVLHQAWQFLGQQAIQTDCVVEFWDKAIQSWQISLVPSVERLSL